MIGHPDADRLAFRILQAARHVRRRPEDHRVGSRRMRLQYAVGPVLDARVGRDFGEIAANQRKVVFPACLANARDLFCRVAIAECAPKSVARVGRIHCQGAFPEPVGRLFDEA